jgi:outer membrane protein assembly factor BamB
VNAYHWMTRSALSMDQTIVFVQDQWNGTTRLLAFDILNGQMIWSDQQQSNDTRSGGPIVIPRFINHVPYSTDCMVCYQTPLCVRCLACHNGTIIWTYNWTQGKAPYKSLDAHAVMGYSLHDHRLYVTEVVQSTSLPTKPIWPPPALFGLLAENGTRLPLFRVELDTTPAFNNHPSPSPYAIAIDYGGNVIAVFASTITLISVKNPYGIGWSKSVTVNFRPNAYFIDR